MSVSDSMSSLDRNSDAQLDQGESVPDHVALVESLVSGDPDGRAAFYDAYGSYVERLLVRVLGPDPEIEDLLHDVFIEALANIGQLRDPTRLKGWLTRMTVFVARGTIRRRRRHRWLVFLPSEDLPVQTSSSPPPEALDLLERVYGILRALRPNHRSRVLAPVHRRDDASGGRGSKRGFFGDVQALAEWVGRGVPEACRAVGLRALRSAPRDTALEASS